MGTYFLVFLVITAFAFYLGEFRKRYDLELELKLVKEKFNLRGLRAREFAHELKHPISAIITTLDSLFVNNKDDYSLEILTVKNEAKELYEFINNFLLICMSETGYLNGKPSSQNLYEVLNQIGKLLEVNAGLKNISVEIPESLSEIELFIDKTHLKQIFFNLINNAIKHNPSGTKICIEYSKNSTAEFAEILVRDNGVGISTENRKKLAGILNRNGDFSDNSNVDGLGLHLSSELAKFSGGNLRLMADGEKGTYFKVVLPVACLKDDLHFGEEKKVLLLSEGTSCSANIAKHIESLGCTVESISEVISALEALGKNDYDAVIVDHKIDNDSGFELAKLIDEELDLEKTKKFVALSDEDFAPEIFSISDQESWPIKREILKELIS